MSDRGSFLRLISVFDFEGKFADRSVGTQGGFQAAGTCVAVAFGLVGGAIVGELAGSLFSPCLLQINVRIDHCCVRGTDMMNQTFQ